jgi:hypothetical protein
LGPSKGRNAQTAITPRWNGRLWSFMGELAQFEPVCLSERRRYPTKAPCTLRD